MEYKSKEGRLYCRNFRTKLQFADGYCIVQKRVMTLETVLQKTRFSTINQIELSVKSLSSQNTHCSIECHRKSTQLEVVILQHQLFRSNLHFSSTLLSHKMTKLICHRNVIHKQSMKLKYSYEHSKQSLMGIIGGQQKKKNPGQRSEQLLLI